MANLDIATKRRPQDGRATVRAASREITLRVSTLPGVTGEKAVLRVLDAHADRTLQELGLPPDMHARLDHLLTRGNGVILVTGRPAAARRRRYMPHSHRSTGSAGTSSRSRTRSSTDSPDSHRCRCTERPAWVSVRDCARCCGRIRT